MLRTIARQAIILSTALSLGCSTRSSTGDVGTIGLELQVGGGIQLDAVAFDLAGNGFRKTGTIGVAGSATITGRIDGVPAGRGFSLSLSATDAHDATIRCQGSATFDVIAGAITMVVVRLECRLPPRTGGVLVNGTVNVCPRIDAVDVLPAEALVGSTMALSGAASDVDARPSPLTYAWTTTAGTLAGAAAANATLTCTAAGAATVTLTVSDGQCSDAVSVTVTCSAAPSVDAGASPAVVRINEIESNGGIPGDWVELFNAGGSAADLSGWVFKDGDDTHSFAIPAGTTLAPGAYLVLDEASFVFGLGAADSARIFDAAANLIDSHSWTAHATSSYGRCPNATGAFATTNAVTKGAANDCGSPPPPPDGGMALAPWPGGDMVVPVDQPNQFGTNMSGLTYQGASGGAPPVLWAVQNSPSKLYRLLENGPVWAPDPAGGWGAGKVLRYPNALGAPDSEGVTRGDGLSAIAYVATERNNDANTISRLSVLRFDTSAEGNELTATHEWNLNADLPSVGANLGLEAITWVPDPHLVAGGFLDESNGQPYDPARYPNHGTGLFLLGLEANGAIYAYALDHLSGAARRVATVASGQIAIMDLAFDVEIGALWAACDNTCGNRLTILTLDTEASSVTRGRFVVRRVFARPSTLPDANHEGITFAPTPECAGGMRRFFWSDDDQTSGHALRMDSIPCGPLL